MKKAMKWVMRKITNAKTLLGCSIICGLLCFAGACLPGYIHSSPTPSPINPVNPSVIVKTVLKHDWQQTICWLSIMGGMLAFFNGSTRGIKFIALGVVGLSVWYMQLVYAGWLAVIGLVGAIALVAYTLLVRSKALKETILGVQDLKERIEGTAIQKRGGISQVLADRHSSTSAALIKNIKSHMKGHEDESQTRASAVGRVES